MVRAIGIARDHGLLGPDLLGSGRAFDLEIRLGAGAYICGEETSLLESLEGRRGQVRFKPPLPAISGLFGRPTVINNLISLATVPVILAEGGEHYRDFGMGRSRGTLPFQLAGNIRHGGLVERAFGLTLRELVEGFGGGTATGRPIRAIQVGGPLGAYWPASLMDVPLDYEEFVKHDGMIGHGGVVVFDDTVDMAAPGRVRVRVLRGRELRQVHALPHRLDARCRDHRQDPARPGDRRQPGAGPRPCRGDARRLALRAGRAHPDAGALRHRPFPRGLRRRASARRRGCGEARRGMTSPAIRPRRAQELH